MGCASAMGAVINARVTQVNFDLGRPRQLALDQHFGERVLDVLLQRAARRACAVAAIGAR